MNNAILMEKIVQSLSLQVEEVQNDGTNQLTSTSRRTPLKVKVKVRKKDKASHSFVSIPKHNPTSTTIDKIRLSNSDQTIMSFDMFMDTDQALPTKKPRHKFLKLLRPGMCLGKPNDEKESYQPSTCHDYSSINSKSDGVYKKHMAVDVSTAVAKRHQYFLGKCKPGGCLDPPFSEDKYSYTPIQKIIEPPVTTFTNKKLFLRDDVHISNQVSVIKSTLSKEKLSHTESTTDVSLIKVQSRKNSLLKLYQAESINTSLSITYSNSIITYPPPLNSSEIRLNNQKNAQKRTSADNNRPKKSFNEIPHTFFIPPKEIKDSCEYKDSLHDDIRHEVEKYSLQQTSSLKSGKGGNVRNIDKITHQDVTLASPTKSENYDDIGNTYLKAAPAIVGIIGSHIPIDNYKHEDATLVDKSGSKNELPQKDTSSISKTHILKPAIRASKSGSITIESVDTLLKPSVRSSLAETHLNLPKNIPQQLAKKENGILSQTMNNLLLSMAENIKALEKRKSTPIVFKSDSKNLYDPNALCTDFGTENNNFNKDEMVHTCYEGSNYIETLKSLLDMEIDSEVSHKLQENQDSHAKKKPTKIINNGVLTDANVIFPIADRIYSETGNEEIEFKKRTPTTSVNNLLFELKEQQQNEFIDNTDTLTPNNKETTNLNNITSGIDYDEKSGYETDNILIKDFVTCPTEDTTALNNNKINTQLETSTTGDYNSDKSKLSPRSSLCAEMNKHLSLNKTSVDKVSLPFSDSTVTMSSKVLLLDKKGELENYEQTKILPEDPKKKQPQRINDQNEMFEDLATKCSRQIIDDAYSTYISSIQQQKDISDTTSCNELIADKNQAISSTNIGNDSSTKDNNLNKDIATFAETNENMTLQNIDQDYGSEELNKEVIEIAMKEVENKQSEHLLRDIDTEHNPQIDQSEKLLLQRELTPTQLIPTHILNANVESKAINITKSIPDIEKENNKEDLSKPTANLFPFLDAGYNNTDNIPGPIDVHDTLIQRISESKINNVISNGIDSEHTTVNKDLIKTIHVPYEKNNLLNNTISQNSTKNFSMLQKTSSEAAKDNLILTEPSGGLPPALAIKHVKPAIVEYQSTTTPLKSTIQEEQHIISDNINNKTDKPDVKSSKKEKQSTIFDVVVFPDPKKLKEDIAALKCRSVLYTPSENTSAKIVKKDIVTVDLAFHSYVNDKNEKIIKSFHSEREPQRYLDDKVILIKSDMELSNNVMKIPIDSENSFFLKIGKAEEDYTLPDVLKENDKLYLDREIDAKKTQKSEVNDIKIPNLNLIYETEMLPLENTIKELKNDIDYLAGHSSLLRDKLITRKSKPVRLTNINKRCVCLKRLF